MEKEIKDIHKVSSGIVKQLEKLSKKHSQRTHEKEGFYANNV